MYPTCFMAVTVITKKRGRPLVTGLVGVSMISCKGERDSGRETQGQQRGEGKECNAMLSKEVQQVKAFAIRNQTPI